MVKENYTDVLHGKVNVQVGKNGFNEGLIKQIIGEFKNKKFIKVRFLMLIVLVIWIMVRVN